MFCLRGLHLIAMVCVLVSHKAAFSACFCLRFTPPSSFEIVQDHLPNVLCFADDTQLYLSLDPNSPTDQSMALEAMERCISDLRKWMYRDKLKINDDKTEFLVIGSRQQLLKIHHFSVRVGTIQ